VLLCCTETTDEAFDCVADETLDTCCCEAFRSTLEDADDLEDREDCCENVELRLDEITDVADDAEDCESCTEDAALPEDTTADADAPEDALLPTWPLLACDCDEVDDADDADGADATDDVLLTGSHVHVWRLHCLPGGQARRDDEEVPRNWASTS